ncbi:MAG TPA: DUF3095 domain-containing protein [Flavitalea sp.]|nr:DUF3095 domain-containing protein [Flavitalea sp.]
MEPIVNDQFYSLLPVNEIPLSDLLTQEHLFYKIPGSWHVVITDIKNSTGAVADGLHETINLVATGCIVAVLNIAYKYNLTVPFFFGGDGATFIIPASLLDHVMKSLLQHRDNTIATFKLDLRVGNVPVQEIYEQQHALNISKLKASRHFSIPIVLGDGLTYAEARIKGPSYMFSMFGSTDAELDLTGMQCRWDKIKPPKNFFEVVSLLVMAKNSIRQAAIFKNVIESIDNIYGGPDNRKPISVSKLRLKATLAKIGIEMHVRSGNRFRPFYVMSQWFLTLLGRLYFTTKKGQVYLNELVEMSDTLVIDGKINTVITGTSQQRQLLVQALDIIENEGEIIYGLYVSNESVMSCYVRSMSEKHIHFVDGAEGGYTKAANVVKQKNKFKQATF